MPLRITQETVFLTCNKGLRSCPAQSGKLLTPLASAIRKELQNNFLNSTAQIAKESLHFCQLRLIIAAINISLNFSLSNSHFEPLPPPQYSKAKAKTMYRNAAAFTMQNNRSIYGHLTIILVIAMHLLTILQVFTVLTLICSATTAVPASSVKTKTFQCRP